MNHGHFYVKGPLDPSSTPFDWLFNWFNDCFVSLLRSKKIVRSFQRFASSSVECLSKRDNKSRSQALTFPINAWIPGIHLDVIRNEIFIKYQI